MGPSILGYIGLITGHMGIMKKKMYTTIFGYIGPGTHKGLYGIMDKEMETTILGPKR